MLGTMPRLWLHGGGAGALSPRLPEADIRLALVLDGLARWAALGDGAGPASPGRAKSMSSSSASRRNARMVNVRMTGFWAGSSQRGPLSVGVGNTISR